MAVIQNNINQKGENLWPVIHQMQPRYSAGYSLEAAFGTNNWSKPNNTIFRRSFASSTVCEICPSNRSEITPCTIPHTATAMTSAGSDGNKPAPWHACTTSTTRLKVLCE